MNTSDINVSIDKALEILNLHYQKRFQPPFSQIKVVVGLSGGVDSCLSAFLLKELGFNVLGLFMKNWDDQKGNGVCVAEKERQDASLVAKKIGIDFYSTDFIEEYYQEVFELFLDQLKKGLTPNPDTLCNRYIKFHHFKKLADELGFFYLATGHYAGVTFRDDKSFLSLAKDKNKDQTYFLCEVNSPWDSILFPLQFFQKEHVKKWANDLSFTHVAIKKESMGICFIGQKNFKEFLAHYLSPKKGAFVSQGKIVGAHDGHQFYTLGQRKGLGLGGPGAPWFVVGKDHKQNIIYVERGEELLFKKEVKVGDFMFLSPFEKEYDMFGSSKIMARLRHRGPIVPILPFELLTEKIFTVAFERPQRAPTPGQKICFYSDDIVLGSATIMS